MRWIAKFVGIPQVLIHFVNPEIKSNNIIKKYKEFENFLLNNLKLMPGRELNLALYYFSNFAGKFVNVQPNMGFEKAKKNLKSTSWDLLLLRIPEFLLAPSNLPELNAAYIVTSEDKLLDIGDMFNVESILYRNINSYPTPFLSFNIELFKEVMSESEIDILYNGKIDLTINQLATKSEKLILDKELCWLIEDLELQLSNLCVQ